MLKQPTLFDQPLVRAIVRIGCVVLPAILFRFWYHNKFRDLNEPPQGDFFGFRRNWILGVVVGIIVSGIFLGVIFLDPMRGEFKPWPKDIATWLNVIIGSPLAEEMLFRCVLATQIIAISQTLDGARGWDSWISAVILSALAFAAFHLPWWIASGQFTIPELVVKSATLFAFGCGFAILFLASRSIWSSLIPHWVNNLVGQLLP